MIKKSGFSRIYPPEKIKNSVFQGGILLKKEKIRFLKLITTLTVKKLT